MAGATALAFGLATAPTAAQPLNLGAKGHAPAAPLPDDGLGPRDLLLEADIVTQDKPNQTVTASGHVQARYQGRTLRADRLEYNTVTGAAHAVGHAVIVNPDGTSDYGDDITLDDQFRAAVAIGFATRQPGNITIAAGAALRRNETVNQLNNAVYTACNVCAQDGSPKPPTWSIQASRIIEDRQHEVVYYRNAVIRVLGVPVFYAPVFWHPDPTSPRRSGLLVPEIEYSRRRGFSYEQPYLQTLGPSTDLIVSPQINTRVDPMLKLRLVQRFYSGMIDIRAGYTYERNFNNDTKFGDDTSRSYILARGLFDIDPQTWVWGFGAERVTDPTLFARYGIHNVYTDRGPFPADTDRLISQLYTVREDNQTYFSLAALDFQSLRAYGTNPATGLGIYESSRAFPIVGPLIEARYDPNDPVLGGQLKLRATAVALTRNEPVISIFDPAGVVPGGPQAFYPAGAANDTLATVAAQTNIKNIAALKYTDSRRASVDLDWRSSFTLNSGIRVEPFLLGRGDFYSLTNAQLYDQSTGGFVAGKDNVERISGTAGATVSWPFIKPIGGASVILEPIAQIALSPVEKLNPNIPNEDSASFEFDETNLFSVDRFAGFDLLEGGQRLNVGGRASVDWGDSHNAQVTAGRTFRAQSDTQFNALSGLEGTASDWVVAATASPLTGLSLFTRSRLDADTFAIRREEAGASYFKGDFTGYVSYNFNESGLSQISALNPGVAGETIGQTVIGRTEDVQIGGTAFFTRHWGVSANVSRDLQQNVFPIAQLGLIYRDECIRVDILYTHDETFGTVIGTSDAVSFRITLATLGDNGPLIPSNNGRGAR